MPRTSPLAPHLREIQARRAAGWTLEAIRSWLRAQHRVATSVSALSRALMAAAPQDLPPVLDNPTLYVRPRTYRARSHSVTPLIRALAAEGMSVRTIAAELAKRGHQISKSTIARVLSNEPA